MNGIDRLRFYRRAPWFCLVFAALPGSDCAQTVPGGMPTSPTASELFTLITQTDPFQQWAQFPDRQGTQPSALPHGPMSRVFANDTVMDALNNFTGALPAGAIIVKENVGDSSQVTEAVLTVMWTVSGFDPENSDWFWANLSTQGDVRAEGRVQGCISCDGGMRANDFVFVHQF